MKTSPEILKLIKYAENSNTLNLSGKGLYEIPEAVFSLTHLTRLSLRNNHIDHIPETISNLTALKELRLDGNKLSALPEAIGALKHLKWLSLNNNQLSELPEEIAELKHLEILELIGNQLSLPMENLVRRPQELIYYILRHQEKRRINEVKLLVLGEPGSGKTSLVRYLVERQFNDEEPSTAALEVHRWPVQTGHKRVQLNIWDFGREDIDSNVHSFFLSRRSFYLLAWDARQSDVTELENWLKMITYFGEGSPVIVALTKSDLGSEEIDRRLLQEKYPSIKAFLYTSAKTGNGISELRELIRKSLLPLENLKSSWEEGWLSVRNRMEVAKKEFIPMREYEEICRNEDIDQAGQKDLLQWLHDLGVVTNFQSDIRLQNTLVLQPRWLNNAIHRIIAAKPPTRPQAILNADDLSWILSSGGNYPKTRYPFILNMMKSYELLFDIEENADRAYLVPRWLPEKVTVHRHSYVDGLALQYHYSFLPGDIIPKLIAKMYPFIEEKSFWQYGFVVADGANQALVECVPEQHLILLKVIGRQTTRRDFLAKIRSYFEYTHTLFPAIDVVEKVPLPDSATETIDYHHLLRLEEKEIETIFPENRDEPISIKMLLNGGGISRASFEEKLNTLSLEIEDLNERIERLWLGYARELSGENRYKLEADIKMAEGERDRMLQVLEETREMLAQAY